MADQTTPRPEQGTPLDQANRDRQADEASRAETQRQTDADAQRQRDQGKATGTPGHPSQSEQTEPARPMGGDRGRPGNQKQ